LHEGTVVGAIVECEYADGLGHESGLLGLAVTLLTLRIEGTDDARGIACGERHRRHILGDDASSTDHGSPPNCDTLEYDTAWRDPSVVSDDYWYSRNTVPNFEALPAIGDILFANIKIKRVTVIVGYIASFTDEHVVPDLDASSCQHHRSRCDKTAVANSDLGFSQAHSKVIA
jgi:hypothetical protein